MKKLNFLFLVIVFAFGMNVNAQDIAMVDNSSTVEKYSDNDNISPEAKKLKAEFLKEIKQQYFIDKGLKVPSDLEIILMSDVYGTIYTYFTFDGKMSRAHLDNIGRYFMASGPTSIIKSRHKLEENIIYKK